MEEKASKKAKKIKTILAALLEINLPWVLDEDN